MENELARNAVESRSRKKTRGKARKQEEKLRKGTRVRARTADLPFLAKEARNSPTRPLARNKKNGENRIFQLSTVDSKVVGEDLRSDALCGNTCRW